MTLYVTRNDIPNTPNTTNCQINPSLYANNAKSPKTNWIRAYARDTFQCGNLNSLLID